MHTVAAIMRLRHICSFLASMFSFTSIEVWNLFVGETLPCRIETGNIHDLYAVPTDTDSFPAGFRYFNSTMHT